MTDYESVTFECASISWQRYRDG